MGSGVTTRLLRTFVVQIGLDGLQIQTVLELSVLPFTKMKTSNVVGLTLVIAGQVGQLQFT